MDYDDQPVGQHKALEIPEQPPEGNFSAAPNLPLNERLVSKNSKTRFEATCELLNEVKEGKIDEKYYPIVQKLLADTHPGVQEKALDILLALLEVSPPEFTDNEIITAIMEKGVISSKTSIKTKSADVLLNIAEFPNTQALLYSALKEHLATRQKLVRATSGYLNLLTQLLHNFGSSVFPVKEVLDVVITQAQSTNAIVKNEAKAYLKEAHRWGKKEVAAALEKLKPVEQEELKKCVADGTEHPVAKRKVRIPAPKIKEKVVQSKEINAKKEEDAIKSETTSDENDRSILPAKEEDKKVETTSRGPILLSKFDEKWREEVVSTDNSAEKRRQLEEVLNIVTMKNMKADDFASLGRALKELLNDSNAGVANLTMQIIGELSFALKEKFSVYAKEVFAVILEKCENETVANDAQKCLELLTHSLKLADILEDIKGVLKSKSSQVKAKALFWIKASVIPKLNEDLLDTWVEGLASILVELVDNSESEVQENALSCLGMLRKITNSSTLDNVMKGMRKENQEKVAELAAKEDKQPIFDNPRSKEKKTAKKEVKKDVQIKIEDVGPLISQEEADSLVLSKLPPEITADYDTLEWKEKQKRLVALSAWIASNLPLEISFTEALALWIRCRLKDFKESNVNIMKESLCVLQTVAVSAELSKKFAKVVVSGVAEKISELKLFEAIQNLILAISDSATPSYVASLMVQLCYSMKSVNGIKNSLHVLTTMLEEYSTDLMPVGLIIDYAKHCLSHANPQIRRVATKPIAAIYSQLGKSVKPLIAAELKENMYKALEEELNGVKTNTIEIKRKLKGLAKSESEAKSKPKDAADSLTPRANIAPQLTSKLISSIMSPAMKTRQEAKTTLEQILAAANGRILPNGLNSLVTALKSRMNEPCKNLAKGFIALVGNLALALGAGFRQYSKTLIQPLMWNLADKQSSIRSETLVAMDKFSEAIGAGMVLNSFGPLLEKDNPELRTEVLRWILKAKNELPTMDASSLVGPLVLVMQDRSKEIRLLAEQVVSCLIPYAGYSAFARAIQDLKPSVKSSLEVVLEKYKAAKDESSLDDAEKESKADVVEKEPQVTNTNTNKGNSVQRENENVTLNTEASENKEKSADKTEEAKVKIDQPPKAAQEPPKTTKEPSEEDSDTAKKTKIPPASAHKNNESKGSLDKEPQSKKADAGKQFAKTSLNWKANAKSGQTSKATRRVPTSAKKSTQVLQRPRNVNPNTLGTSVSYADLPNTRPMCESRAKDSAGSSSREQLSANTSIGAGELISAEAVVISSLGNKERRAEMDRNVRWPTHEVRKDYVDKLKRALRSAVNPLVFDCMFSGELKKNLEAIRLLAEAVRCDVTPTVDILDLLFKWVTTKMVEQGNLVINKKIVEYLRLLFEELRSRSYVLMDFEAAAILPILCERLGINNAGLKNDYRQLLKALFGIYAPSKVCGYLVAALDSKSQRTKAEALSVVREHLAAEGHGMAAKDVKALARMLDEGDSLVKAEAVECFVELYKRKGEKLWGMVGSISDKKKEILKTKFAQVVPYDTVFEETLSSIDPKATEEEIQIDLSPSSESQAKEEDKSLGASTSFASIEQCLRALKDCGAEPNFDLLVSLDEHITRLAETNAGKLKAHANDVFMLLVKTLKSTFASEVPLKFKTYFLNMLHDVCSIQPLVREVSEGNLCSLMEEFMRLLASNDTEASIQKFISDSLLELTASADPTKLFAAILALFKLHKRDLSVPEDAPLSKAAEILIKCALRFSKVLSLADLDVCSVLLAMHEFLLENSLTPKPRTQYDVIGVRLLKTILNDLVKACKEDIWKYYKESVEVHPSADRYLNRWINIILDSTKSHDSTDELKMIFKGLKSKATFSEAIRNLNAYMKKHPQTKLSHYLASCSRAFRQLITSSLNECRERPNTELEAELREQLLGAEEEKAEGSLAEYKRKMELLSQKLGVKSEKGNREAEVSTSKGKDMMARINRYKAMVNGEVNENEKIN